MTLDPRVIRALANWPVTLSVADKMPVISDGYHSRADFASGRAKRIHRGVDILWKRAAKVSREEAGFPFGSPLFYAPRGEYERPVAAAGAGRVFRAETAHVEGGKVTGGAVILEHADGVGTGYHHLARVYVAENEVVEAGQLIGIMGGSPRVGIDWNEPVFVGLVHLHFDLAIDGKFIDSAPYLAPLRALSLEQAWGETVSVGQPDDSVA